MGISVIKKRDGRIVPFDVQKIIDAIGKAFAATDGEGGNEALATDLALEVYTLLDLEGNPAPTVEHVQDIAEQVLMREGYTQTAKNYILYRQERSRIRHSSDESERRFGGAPVVLTAALSDCSTIEDAVFAALAVLRERDGQTVSDFAQAMTPAVAGSFLDNYCLAMRCALELTAGIAVNPQTQAAWHRGLAQRGLCVSVGADADALSREADLICGTLGCDRDTVLAAQQFSLKTAARETKRDLREALQRLLQCTGLSPDALCGEAESPEGQLVAEVLQELK